MLPPEFCSSIWVGLFPGARYPRDHDGLLCNREPRWITASAIQQNIDFTIGRNVDLHRRAVWSDVESIFRFIFDLEIRHELVLQR